MSLFTSLQAQQIDTCGQIMTAEPNRMLSSRLALVNQPSNALTADVKHLQSNMISFRQMVADFRFGIEGIGVNINIYRLFCFLGI